jgi:lipoprotein-anchoring transpeptidase ErfK/SrfK
MLKSVIFLFLSGLIFPATTKAEGTFIADEESGIEELNSFAPNVEQFLERFDSVYEEQTGLSPFPAGRKDDANASGCYQTSCAVFVDIDKGSQTLRLYINGRLTDQWLVSTGRHGYGTPDFNKHFTGRLYIRYDSSRYPGGDYRGLGNMPYAMFISGGVALHGTPQGNWSRLGRRASHGCIRILPTNAQYLNSMLRRVGVSNSWVRVH